MKTRMRAVLPADTDRPGEFQQAADQIVGRIIRYPDRDIGLAPRQIGHRAGGQKLEPDIGMPCLFNSSSGLS